MGERNLREQGETNGFGQLEDKVMKTAAQFFGEDLLPYIGVKGKILTVAPTEHVHLEKMCIRDRPSAAFSPDRSS